MKWPAPTYKQKNVNVIFGLQEWCKLFDDISVYTKKKLHRWQTVISKNLISVESMFEQSIHCATHNLKWTIASDMYPEIEQMGHKPPSYSVWIISVQCRIIQYISDDCNYCSLWKRGAKTQYGLRKCWISTFYLSLIENPAKEIQTLLSLEFGRLYLLSVWPAYRVRNMDLCFLVVGTFFLKQNGSNVTPVYQSSPVYVHDTRNLKNTL